MDCLARLVVTRGPDEGRAFDVTTDLAHIGRDLANQIVLNDPELASHQASILCRGGRYALSTPVNGSVQVDGAQVPAERWIWLPSAAEISLGMSTVVRFEVAATASEVEASSGATAAQPEPTAEPAASPPAARKDGSSSITRRRRRKTDPRKSGPRLTIDPGGEPRVQLGADGRLPELTLAASATETAEEAERGQVRPWLAVAAVVASSVVSVLLLFWLPDSGTPGGRSIVIAREQLKEFYGREGETPEPYQSLLRQAAVERSQGRLREERRMYLRVLDLLNSADVRDPRNYHGLTGPQTGRGRNSDRELRELLEQLISSHD